MAIHATLREVYTYTHTLELVSIAGIYAVWGLGPSRGSPKFSILHSSLPPSRAVLYSLLEGGKGARTAQHSAALAGRSAGWPSLALKPEKDDDSGDGKGAVTSWVTRPIFLLYLRIHTAMQQQRQGAAKPRAAKPTEGR